MDYSNDKNSGRQKTCRKCRSYVTHDKMEDGRLVCPLCGQSIGVAPISTPHVSLHQFRKMIADFNSGLSVEDPNAKSIEAFLDAKLGMVRGSPIKKDLAAAQKVQSKSSAEQSTESGAESQEAMEDGTSSLTADSQKDDHSVSGSQGFDPADFGLTDDDMDS